MRKTFRLLAFLLSILTVFSLIPVNFSAEAAGAVVYVKDGGNDANDGSSPSSAKATLKTAINAVSGTGGTVVVCGPLSVKSGVVPTAHSNKVTVTSLYNGTDYAKTAGAKLIFTANIALSGPMEFNNVTLATSVVSGATNMYPYNSIKPKGNELVIGDGIKNELLNGCETYLSIVDGNNAQKITINSGNWQRVRGNDYGSSTSVNFTINGGTFHEKLIITGENGNYQTNVTAVINGGEFLGGVYLVAFEKDGAFKTNPTYSGNVNITVNGGAIYGPLSVSYRRLGTFIGSYTLNLNGGELHRITEICGPGAVGGTMTSTLNYGENVDPTAVVTGSETFEICLCEAADPFVFYHNGMYYMTSTGGASIGLSCAANLSDLGEAAKTTIFKTTTYKNAWSPEIHHFTDEEIGEGNGGWYLFLGLANTEDTDHSGQREYVLKCLDGDYLLGKWGDPVTGAVNQPRAIEFTYSNSQGENYNDIFCAGMSIVRIDGQVYMTFVSEIGRTTSSFHQTINIVEFETPWNITGKPVQICKSDYSWEMQGYGGSGTKWYPKVVEGCSPVYGEDGSLYLMYTGSGYWTTWYALGYMKYVGTDPLDPASWQKNPTPILQRKPYLTSKTVNGCGHGSYFTDANGKMWVCYHGYVGTNTDSGRFAFLEPIYVSESGVSIGGEGIYPPDKGETQTEPLNHLPIDSRAEGFANKNVSVKSPHFTGASLTIENSIAVNFIVACTDERYTNVRVDFNLDGRKSSPAPVMRDDGRMVFTFTDLTPAMMSEKIEARLYATFEGNEYLLKTVEYSIADYCYNMLSSPTHTANTAFRTLVVDLLNYGAEAQKYVNNRVDKLVNASLTATQKAWGTQTQPTYTSILSFSEDPATVKATWKGASLNLKDTVRVNYRFAAESVDNLTVVITLGGRTYRYNSGSFVYDNGTYLLTFSKIIASQLSEPIEATIYEGDTPVSKTVTYSVESYAASVERGEEHFDMVTAIMKYGNAVKAYVKALN